MITPADVCVGDLLLRQPSPPLPMDSMVECPGAIGTPPSPDGKHGDDVSDTIILSELTAHGCCCCYCPVGSRN